jgi:hypothetical protein
LRRSSNGALPYASHPVLIQPGLVSRRPMRQRRASASFRFAFANLRAAFYPGSGAGRERGGIQGVTESAPVATPTPQQPRPAHEGYGILRSRIIKRSSLRLLVRQSARKRNRSGSEGQGGRQARVRLPNVGRSGKIRRRFQSRSPFRLNWRIECGP